MKENVLTDELLATVLGGSLSSEDLFNDLDNAMNQVDGKKCKYCGTVFSKNDLIYGHRAEMLQISKEFKAHGREMLPCYGCHIWRNIRTDFE